jgi:hypothetical protein
MLSAMLHDFFKIKFFHQSDDLSDLFVDVSCKSASGSGSTNLSPIHFCPHQHNPSALIRQVPVPQQR